jgi:5-methylcytosine-specific restriction endonuclease McrA
LIKYCRCGCNQPIPIPEKGIKNYTRLLNKTFIHGHNGKLNIKHLLKLANSRIGTHLSNITKEKIGKANSIALKGRHLSQSTKDKLSKLLTGRPVSKSTRLKISIAKKGKPFTQEHINNIRIACNTKKYCEQLSQRTKGNKCHFWKGGITPINKIIKQSKEYKNWRESVFKRDNYTCIYCGLRGGCGIKVILHPHHLQSFAEFQESRFDINNGITLCHDCHKFKTDYGVNTNKRNPAKRQELKDRVRTPIK